MLNISLTTSLWNDVLKRYHTLFCWKTYRILF
nr:MAG TPA: hypothetical protein [Bacteriophage sp.]